MDVIESRIHNQEKPKHKGTVYVYKPLIISKRFSDRLTKSQCLRRITSLHSTRSLLGGVELTFKIKIKHKMCQMN